MGKKPEDNRDVFEKALDDARENPAPYGLAGGAVLGALAGRGIARGYSRKADKAFKNNAGRAGGALGAIVGAPNFGTPIALALESDGARERRLAKLKKPRK